MIRPAIAIVAIFTAIAVWNDFFFPLIFIFDDDYKTLPLAITTFIGQFRTDWGMVFASLAISMMPVVIMYFLLARQIREGVGAGGGHQMIEEQIYASRSILVVGAHAFDAEVIAGPLAAVAADRGAGVTFLHLSMGEQGHSRLSAGRLRPAEAAGGRRGRPNASVSSWRSFDLPDGFLPDDDLTALRVADVIRELRPETVITHWHGSWHKDHRAAAGLTHDGRVLRRAADARAGRTGVYPNPVLFGENWEDDEGF